MGLTSILKLLAGIGLFLYGMSMMGDGLKDIAGNSLEKILEKLTNSRIKGLALGTAVTAIIQSSAATCIMLLGFINANIMGLSQAIPVAFGANIGSTITGQILRLGDLAEGNIILTLLKPSSFASLLIAYGTVVLVFIKSKKKRFNSVAYVLLGLGILFFGMNTMESTISPLRDNPAFVGLFTMFSNPFVGILVGVAVTTIIQSSSASVGILQALSSTGAISWSVAIPIILGQNIGKCSTVLLGCIGASKDSKRLAMIHTLFNVLGVIIIAGLLYLVNSFVHFSFWDVTVNRGNIADFHTVFNFATAIILLPFTNVLAKLAQKIIPDDATKTKHHRVDQLDDLLLKTPMIALDAARKVTIQMGYAARENFDIVSNFVTNGGNIDKDQFAVYEENENFLDTAESKISDYLVRINPQGTHANLDMNEILRSVGDFERIGDYCDNIYDMIIYNQENNLSFSDVALQEITQMNDAIHNILDLTVQAFETRDFYIASQVEPLEQVIDSLKEVISSRHIERLRNNLCSVQAGISLMEYLNSVERISDHCSNVAIHSIRSRSTKANFDTHSYLNSQHQKESGEYVDQFQIFSQKYLVPVQNLTTVEEELAQQKKKRDLEYLASVGENVDELLKAIPVEETSTTTETSPSKKDKKSDKKADKAERKAAEKAEKKADKKSDKKADKEKKKK